MVKKKNVKELENENPLPKKKEFDLKKFFKKNYGFILAGVLLVILLSFLIFENITGKCVYNNFIDKSDIKNIVEDIYDNLGYDAEVLSVVAENNFYKVSISVEGYDEVLYFTLDGKEFIPDGFILSVKEVLDSSPQSNEVGEVVAFSEQDLIEISNFMQCLASKDVKVYGANWCGYTNALVENLGGFGVISPIYVECTEEQELCAEEQIQGYPTIKIAGEIVNIDRTLKGFADAANCEMPSIDLNNQVSTNINAGC